MAFACAIMIVYASLMAGMLQTMEKNAIGNELGDVQIHAPGFRADQDLYKYVEDANELVKRIEEKGFKASPRLYAFGLAASGKASAGVRLRGIDLDREPLVTKINTRIYQGQWLDAHEPSGVVIGRKLSKTLGAGVGAEVVFVGQAADGSLANEIFTVRGVLKSIGAEVDSAGFLLPIASFRKLIILPTGAHEIVIRGGRQEDSPEKIRAVIAGIAPDEEVLSWRQLQPVLARIIDLSRSSLIIMLLITYSAVGMLTLNGMLMGVFERIREFGVMKALGFSPLKVFSLIAIESFCQVCLASLLAMATGLPLSLYLTNHPIDLSALASTSSSIAGTTFDPVWHSTVTVETVVLPIVFLFLVAAAAILYPAMKAALIRPVESMVHH
jgi:ABC-type lipoprotein release transport system permease subunit